MKKILLPGNRYGKMAVPSSKSQAHRLLICAALSDGDPVIEANALSEDILATIDCLNALGAKIEAEKSGRITVLPIGKNVPEHAQLYCRESGSTLRFLIPVVCALGIDTVFHMEGRLPMRPVDELTDACGPNGMKAEKDGELLRISGKLAAGTCTVNGRISSQYITGLLFALPLVCGTSVLRITGGTESSAYIKMTEDALLKSGICFQQNGDDYIISGPQKYRLPKRSAVETDWSGAAFPLCMGAFSKRGVSVSGLDAASVQGDKRILGILKSFGAEVSVVRDTVTVKRKTLHAARFDASGIPDLVPAVSVVASVCEGTTVITGAGRLRLKESDRIKSTVQLIRDLGGCAEETSDGLMITGRERLSGGEADSYHDHRIAMAAALAACVCEGAVTISDPLCVNKSFPGFFEEFDGLEVEK